MMKQIVETELAPAAIGPYSQAVRAGEFLFCSGQIPIDPLTGALVTGSVVDETDQIMKNLSAILQAVGATLESVVKTTIFLTDLGDFAKVNEAYAKYFKGAPPARATIQVAALPKGAHVEIEAIAYVGV